MLNAKWKVLLSSMFQHKKRHIQVDFLKSEDIAIYFQCQCLFSFRIDIKHLIKQRETNKKQDCMQIKLFTTYYPHCRHPLVCLFGKIYFKAKDIFAFVKT